MMATSSEAKCNDDELCYPGPLFTGVSSFFPGTISHCSNDAAPFQIREATNEKQKQSKN